MAETTQTAEVNGKATRNKKPVVPIFETEIELRAFPIPAGMKMYQPMLLGKMAYTADWNPQNALLRFAIQLGGKAEKLGQTARPEKVLGDMLSLKQSDPARYRKLVLEQVASLEDLPEDLRKKVAQVNATASLPNESPTGNPVRKK